MELAGAAAEAAGAAGVVAAAGWEAAWVGAALLEPMVTPSVVAYSWALAWKSAAWQLLQLAAISLRGSTSPTCAAASVVA